MIALALVPMAVAVMMVCADEGHGRRKTAPAAASSPRRMVA